MATDPGDGRRVVGVRGAIPLFAPTFAIGITYGMLAEPVMGPVAPIVMSICVFAGAAQFAALIVLAAGGGTWPAAGAGLLVNARFLPMSFAVGPSLRGRRWSRALQGQAIVDASFALANDGDGRFDRRVLLQATAVQAPGWILGTATGVLVGARIPSAETLGLDAIFPAFYLGLLWPELSDTRKRAVTMLGAAIALTLTPVAPPGVPVLAASAAALVGLTRR